MSKMNEAVLTRGLEAVRGAAAVRLAAVVVFAAALAVSAHVRVPLPFTPVPVTLQTMIVLLAGVTLGPRLGAAAVGCYLAAGAAGLPVTASGALIGPTTGYLVGFVPAVMVAGALARPQSSTWRIALAMLAATAVVYVLGVGWLAAMEGRLCGGTLCRYVLPFVAGDSLKLVASVGLARAGRCLRLRREV